MERINKGYTYLMELYRQDEQGNATPRAANLYSFYKARLGRVYMREFDTDRC
jgi:hypothetical protein